MTRTRHIAAARPTLWAVTLIDRRTGRPHHVNGIALTALGRDPHATAAELMRNRDPRAWDARILPLSAVAR